MSVDPMSQAEKDKLFSKIKREAIRIDISKSANEYHLLKMLVEKYSLKQAGTFKGNIGFYPINVIRNNAEQIGKSKVNKIRGMAELSNKSTTCRIINFLQKIYPEEYDFVPRTFRIPQQQKELQVYWENNPELVFIFKPADAYGGDGIEIFTSYSDLIEAFKTASFDNYVAQIYIQNPLLLDGRKFDLRIYVLVASLDPLIVYINEEGLGRFCTEEYSEKKKFKTKDLYKHLTNYCFNKGKENYVSSNKREDLATSTKRPLSLVLSQLEKVEGFKREYMLEKIRDIVLKTVKALLPFAYKVWDKKMKMFQILGLDVILDANLKPWLLEVNSNPSLNIFHMEDTPKKEGMSFSYVDVLVKEKVVRDSIIIALTRKSLQEEIKVGGVYNSFRMLEFARNVEDKGEPVIIEAAKLYDSLLGVRDKANLNGICFEKLLRRPGLKCSKVALQLVFARHCTGNKLDLFGFIHCLDEIHSLHHPKHDFLEFVAMLRK